MIPVRVLSEMAKALAAVVIAITFVVSSLVPGSSLAAQIVVEQVGPLSGLEANQGRAYAAGMQSHFNALNKVGGINGHTFTLARKDDGGRPEDTVNLTRQLITESKPVVLAGYFGNKNIADLVASGLLEQERLPLVGYRISEIRAEAPYLYSVRAGLRDEIRKLTEHLSIMGITRLGLFHEAGSGSGLLIAAVEEAARTAKVNVAVRASYAANTVSVSGAVETFIKQPPQAIILISSGAAAAGFVEMYRASGGSAQLFAHSGADIEQLSKRLDEEQMKGVAIAQVTPSPCRITSRLTKEFSDNVNKVERLEVPVSYAMMEGYITARVIAEAVRRHGGVPTRDGIAQALNSMDRFDMGGYLITFKDDQRSGSRFVELSIISSTGRIRQ